MQMKWIQQLNNMKLDTDWGYISYNEKTGNRGPLSEMFDYLASLIGIQEKGLSETALCIEPEDSKILYAILKGDHRKAYEGKSLAECLEYYKRHEDQKSDWSTFDPKECAKALAALL